MTTAQRGGGPRSLGASLLDQVLAETLDPAYARAARAREAHAQGEEPPPSRRRRGQLAVALVLALAGLLAAVTYDQAAAGAQGREEVRSALVSEIEGESETTDRLAADLESLRVDVAAARDDALAATAVGQRVRDRVQDAELAAGALPVSGPGLRVTLADAGPDADEDPVGGTTEADPRGQVRDGDLQLVVNALWASGAEAVGINGQRLGPTTAIRFAGEAVLVDFRPVTNPYLVSAVGDPATLRSRFLASPEVNALAVISETYGLRFEFAQEDELSLPAGSPPELRSAVPVSEVPPAVPTGDAAPEPTPGG
ncbi:Uncharacterized conserved protein YlxW, UPF0749 family [Geodermatophilus siccatus]|uniref:Uncharacterized conserved protein YlxW, UPF0749 family n=1 Tax=Geodermatophilus siccatus TaxID=1137991 RepID=A0A1G9N0W9_9ACTN|nr:DUF881 domain-containing protein [Geodermatophilus siccatus]SDL79777.1 Uncharacterized conserved protein YlxW, UPF0749 family [Geodermatophilus siccatus]